MTAGGCIGVVGIFTAAFTYAVLWVLSPELSSLGRARYQRNLCRAAAFFGGILAAMIYATAIGRLPR